MDSAFLANILGPIALGLIDGVADLLEVDLRDHVESWHKEMLGRLSVWYSRSAGQ